MNKQAPEKTWTVCREGALTLKLAGGSWTHKRSFNTAPVQLKSKPIHATKQMTTYRHNLLQCTLRLFQQNKGLNV